MCGDSAKYWKTGNLWQEVGNPILILHLNLDLLIFGGQKLEKHILPLKGGREREREIRTPSKQKGGLSLAKICSLFFNSLLVVFEKNHLWALKM